MNILLCPSSYAPNVGGVEEVTAGLAGELHAAGHGVFVAAPRWPAHVSERETVRGIEVRRFDFGMPSKRPAAIARFMMEYPRTIRLMSDFAKEKRIDLVHVHCLGPNTLYAARVAKKLGKPLVLTTHGELQDIDQKGSIAISATRKWSLARANWVTACSRYTLSMARVPAGIPSSVIYNGLRPASLSNSQPPPAASRFILCAARLTKNKGIDVAVRAFALASKTMPNVELWVAGDGPERSALEELSQGLGMETRVRFLGMLTAAEVDILMHRCFFFVCPSRNEGFGLVNLEAMAAGKAVVASNVGGIPELVKNGITGMLVPVGDIEVLGATMARIAADDLLRTAMEVTACGVAQRYQWPQIIIDYVQIYSVLCGRCGTTAIA